MEQHRFQSQLNTLDNTIRGLCIGLGPRGKAWYQWSQQAGMHVVGVVDINRKLLDTVGDELGIPSKMRFTSISEAARQTDATVSVVCTANHTHTTCLKECFDCRLHVMIEKPMVERPEDGAAVLDWSRKSKCRIAVAQNFRYDPRIIAARNAIENGTIGQLSSVQIRFARWRPAPGMYLPLLLNQAIHHFDAVRYILDGPWSWCYASSRVADWSSTEGPSMLTGIWCFETMPQVVFSYSGSYVTQGRPTCYLGQWWIEGNKGRIEFDGDVNTRAFQLWMHNDAPPQPLDMPLLDIPEPAIVLREFLLALQTGRPAPTEITDNLKSLGMCWAAQRSSDERRVVEAGEVIPA